MTPLHFFLIPLFAIWADDGSGATEHMVFLTDDSETWCDHDHADGCVVEFAGELVIITEDPFKQSRTGYNILTHEWYHLMGYKEHEIPRTIINQEFRK